MKFYKREIRPIIVPPSLQGFNCEPYPYKNKWYPENIEKNLRDTIKIEDKMSRLIFEERYIEGLEIDKLRIRENDTIIMTINPEIIDLDIAQNCVKNFQQNFNNNIIVKFKGVEIEVK